MPKATSSEDDDQGLYADFLKILEQKSDIHYNAVLPENNIPYAMTSNYSELTSL